MKQEFTLRQENVPSMTPKNYHTNKFYLRILLLSPLILIKAIFTIFFLLSAWVHCNIYNYLFPANQWIFDVYFYPVYQWLQRGIIFSAGILYIKTTDERERKKGASIFVTNHLGIMDYILFFSQIKGRPLAKKEFFTMPFLRTFAVFIQFIPVDRCDKEKRKAAFNKLREAVDGLQAGDDSSILICPEMCTTSGKGLLHFATGAFRFQNPVNPLVLKFDGPYENTVLRGDESYVPSIIDILSCWKIDCELHYLKEYVPNEEECRDPRLYANNVRNLMAKALKVNTTEYIYSDVLIYNASYVLDTETKHFDSLFYDGYIDFKQLDSVFKVGDYKKIIKLINQFKKELELNKDMFLLSTKDIKMKQKVSFRGFERGVKLTDYIILNLEDKMNF
eukprot:GAHX01001873.1.p1 GENE.GAHX01001873.1~~GAHX01001873.1.p1  ORF type:complete len:403 (-),score=58.92 GAHX01001873.1:204-1376(-)